MSASLQLQYVNNPVYRYERGSFVSPKAGMLRRRQNIYSYPNGYGASVVMNEDSYGAMAGLWELAVLDKNGDLCYTTPITNNVIGWLTWDQVDGILKQISELPKIDE